MRYVGLFIVFMFTFLVGCTKSQVCDTAKTASGLVSAQVAVQLECKNLDAIRADVEKKLIDLKICEAPAQKSVTAIGDVICKPVIEGLVSGLLTQIPSAWECTGGKVTDDVKAKLLEACIKAM